MVGSSKGCESVFYITVSTGVGGALIMDKKIINGAHSETGEIHNMIINEDEYSHSGLNKGGLEGQCSGVNLARIAGEAYGRNVSTKVLFNLYKKDEEKAVKIIEDWVNNISTGIANIISVLDPEVLVIGGAVLIYNQYILVQIIECVKKKVTNHEKVDIRIAKIGENVGLIGAALL